MSEQSAERQAEATEKRKLQTVRSQGRDSAILRGRLYAEDEARNRGETGLLREQRIARAMAYAAWEHDGKPFGEGERYEKEFGVQMGRPVTEGITATFKGGPDPKNGKEKK